MPNNAQIIEKVNELIELCNKNGYWQRRNKVGSSNIRGVASAIQNAECFKEVELYIKYKEAKRNGWDERIGTVTFANKILNHLNYLTNNIQEEKEKLQIASKYFGYLYWAVYTYNKDWGG